MFNFLKRKKNPDNTEKTTQTDAPITTSLSKTRQRFSDSLGSLFLGKKTLDHNTFKEIESHLLTADIGVAVTKQLIDALTRSVKRQQLTDTGHLYQHLRTLMIEQFDQATPAPPKTDKKPTSYLLVGANGSGKTTTIAKLANISRNKNHSVLIAAGDTYRAAAIEQLQTWGERHQVPVIAQQTGSDSASVCYDALHAAQARQCDVLLIDTAGRLHTQNNLMAELQKVVRVLQKLDPNAPHETWLVIDAGTGQNGLEQAQRFHEALPLTGIILTKMDGTAKGGIAFSIVQALGLPIRFIGLGEQSQDLHPFDPQTFVDAILAPPENNDTT